MSEEDLTEREMMIARKAARLAVEEVMSEFYRSVGKSVVNRFLIVLGAMVVGWLGAHGMGFWK